MSGIISSIASTVKRYLPTVCKIAGAIGGAYLAGPAGAASGFVLGSTISSALLGQPNDVAADARQASIFRRAMEDFTNVVRGNKSALNFEA